MGGLAVAGAGAGDLDYLLATAARAKIQGCAHRAVRFGDAPFGSMERSQFGTEGGRIGWLPVLTTFADVAHKGYVTDQRHPQVVADFVGTAEATVDRAFQLRFHSTLLLDHVEPVLPGDISREAQVRQHEDQLGVDRVVKLLLECYEFGLEFLIAQVHAVQEVVQRSRELRNPA